MSAIPSSSTGSTGPLGQQRGIGFGILLFIVTFGIYGLYWAYKTQEEMKQRTGEGLGGVLGLVIWILIGAVSAFVIPSEVGKMHAKDGLAPPITGWMCTASEQRCTNCSPSARPSPPATARGCSDNSPPSRWPHAG